MDDRAEVIDGLEEEKTRVSEVSQIPVSRESCLVSIDGRDLGRKYNLDDIRPTRIGRGPENNVVVEMDNVSRSHAIIEPGERGFSLRDEKSTNGTYINNNEVKEATYLSSGDLVKVGGAIFKFLQGDLEAQFYETIYKMTIVDGLTQIYNKRYFSEFLDREMARCARYDRPLALLLLDIDHFKQVNDINGHLAGDAVLKTLAETVSHHVRKEECFARYGGEEFGIIMPETNGSRARIFAEKICKMVEDSAFTYDGRSIPITVSIGIAEMGRHKDTDAFIAAADQLLYQAKANGRNRVEGGRIS